MSTTNSPAQQNSSLEQTTLGVIQQLKSAGLEVERKDNPDLDHRGRRGHCPGVELSITHSNGASCTIEVKHLNDFDGGFRAVLTVPVEGTDTSSVLTIRAEDLPRRDFGGRLTALVSHAIKTLNVLGRDDSFSDIQFPG